MQIRLWRDSRVAKQLHITSMCFVCIHMYLCIYICYMIIQPSEISVAEFSGMVTYAAELGSMLDFAEVAYTGSQLDVAST